MLLEAITGRDPVDYGRPQHEVCNHISFCCSLQQAYGIPHEYYFTVIVVEQLLNVFSRIKLSPLLLHGRLCELV